MSSPVEAREEDVLDDDGEEEREAFDLLYMLKKEEEMLIAAKEKQSKGGEDFAREILDERTKQAETWHRDAASQAAFSKPAEPITCATFAQDVIEGRVKLSQARAQAPTAGIWSLIGGRLTSERKNDSPSLPTRS